MTKTIPVIPRAAAMDVRPQGLAGAETAIESPPPSVAVGNRSPTSADASVGGRIKELRRAAGRTQKEIADIVGVTGAQFHRYETGATRIATSRLLGIATALGVRPEVLVGTAAPRSETLVDFTDGATDELVELVQVFSTINDPRRRHALMAFARAVARGQPLAAPGAAPAPE
ncbi:helix-turn-helix domain-containing protein [Falsiroseomonas selenitidurans]|uniref:Helix-turn-helix domain-containing protein n=1 Tax=Falsiroseomonas selenitidurans TaxID=2716335 RepID=A0ABX1E0B6_9PROT|nr:helix-turn-helix domain-containing protein [Falsiroseomonas selenitidurans]NKC30543.1 helix-turn-helix domain-containing protein [Falsiroseomonas selenitidurans]